MEDSHLLWFFKTLYIYIYVLYIHTCVYIYTVYVYIHCIYILHRASKELPSTLCHFSQVGMLPALNQSFFARWPWKMFQTLEIQNAFWVAVRPPLQTNIHEPMDWKDYISRHRKTTMHFTPLDMTDFEDWRALHEQWSGQTRVIQVGVADGYCWSSACICCGDLKHVSHVMFKDSFGRIIISYVRVCTWESRN